MAEDVSPLTALVRICEALPQAHDPDVRRALIRASAAARVVVLNKLAPPASGISHRAQRLLDALGEQKMHRTRWAKEVGSMVDPDGGTFKRAVRELVTAGLVTVDKRGTYRRAPLGPKLAQTGAAQTVSEKKAQ